MDYSKLSLKELKNKKKYFLICVSHVISMPQICLIDDWIKTRKMEKELKRINKKDQNAMELKGFMKK